MATDDIKETADAVGEAAGIIERGVEAVAEQIAELAATYGELAWETTLTIVRIDAAQSLLVGVILAAMAVAAIFWVVAPLGKNFRAALRAEPDDDYYSMARRTDAVFGYGIGCGVSCVPTAFMSIAAFNRLFDVWNWVALFAPELYLAKRALDAVVSL